MRHKHLLFRVADHARNTLAPSTPLAFLYPSFAPLHTSSNRSLRSSRPTSEPHYSATAELLAIEDETPSKRPSASSSQFSFYRHPHLPAPATSSSTTHSAPNSAEQAIDDLYADIQHSCQTESDPAHLVHQCKCLVQADPAHAEKVGRWILLSSRHLLHLNHLLMATSVVQDMIKRIGWPAYPDLLAHVDDLLARLTLHQQDSSRKPNRGFASHAHYTAATQLLTSMRAAGIPRSPVVQTALLRAMLRSRMTTAAVQFYAAEVQEWCATKGTGKPSAQALREIRQSLSFREKWLAHHRATVEDKVEYGQSLVVLSRLLTVGRLPIPQSTSPADIAWIISACSRFQASVSLANVLQTDGQYAALQQAAETIRGYMTEYIHTLPTGHLDNDKDVRPPLDMHSYNQLIHYAMAVLRSATLCKQVFAHMINTRCPPLVPDTVTFNTILRQATAQRYDALARTVLTAEPQASEPKKAIPVQEEREAARTALHDAPSNPMLVQADAAIARADSHRLVALTQYITASSLFHPRYRQEAGYVAVSDWIMRIYPSLNKFRHARQSTSFGDASTRLDRTLRYPADRAGRLAILNPHVLTAVLNLAAKAGKTGLALRVWRLLKRTSLQSSPLITRSDVADKQWSIPVQAATIVMQVLAKEALKFPEMAGTSSSLRFGTRSSAARRRALMAHGWNMAASRPLDRTRRMVHPAWRTRVGEGMRWISARQLAQREYTFLLQHWGLTPSLGEHRLARLSAWHTPTTSTEHPAQVMRKPVVPDTRFFSALLSIFGRQHPHLRSRRPFDLPSPELQHQQVGENVSQVSEDAMLHTVAAAISQSTAASERQCDPFLLLLLLDVEALGLPIPPAYQWILAHQHATTPPTTSGEHKQIDT